MKSALSVAAALFLPLVLVPFGNAAKNEVQIVGMKNGLGKSIGTIIVRDEGPGVVLELHLHGLTPGEHAIHFHEFPKCEDMDFKSAGGHFNPEEKKHGFDNPEGHHAGDMRNFTVGANGKAKGRVENPDVTLKPGPRSLRDNGGVAIVIHAKADDYKTDPAGNSGARVACGVLAK
jgi:Cu-Zn family superoxide dismutase